MQPLDTLQLGRSLTFGPNFCFSSTDLLNVIRESIQPSSATGWVGWTGRAHCAVCTVNTNINFNYTHRHHPQSVFTSPTRYYSSLSTLSTLATGYALSNRIPGRQWRSGGKKGPHGPTTACNIRFYYLLLLLTSRTGFFFDSRFHG